MVYCNTTFKIKILLNKYRWFGFSTNLTADGHRVIVTKNITDEESPGRYLDCWTKYFYMCIDWNLLRTTGNGVIMIYDMSMSNKNEILTQMTPSFLKKSLHCSVSNHILSTKTSSEITSTKKKYSEFADGVGHSFGLVTGLVGVVGSS